MAAIDTNFWNYSQVNARFRFWNGKDGFTVEYAYGLRTWYIFKEYDTQEALKWYEQPTKIKNVNGDMAENIFIKFLRDNIS